MVEKYTLRNGIPVFVVESRSAPVVSIQAWVSRGSIHEREPVSGISHFLEHALFKGTKKRDVGEIALEIESRGGEINAFTSFEETVYYTTLASRYFEEGLDVIADAIQYPTFDAGEMLREREVILEEIKRAHDSPHKTVSMNLWAESFPGTPYGRPVLGFDKTVRKIDHRTLREYHSAQYHAGTVSLFVVGDVDAIYVREQAQKLLGKMRAKKANKEKPFSLRKRSSVGFRAAAREINECQVQLAFITPGVRHLSTPGLDLMCSAVGQGESSPLYQRLVKELQLAMDVQMGLVATRQCGLATIGIQAAPDNMVKAITECWKTLHGLADSGLRNRDLERVKSSLESDIVAGKETVEGYARRLGYYFIQFDDPNYENRYLESVLSVNADLASDCLRALLTNRPVISMAHPKKLHVEKAEILAAVPPIKQKTQAKSGGTLPTKTQVGSIRFITRAVNSLPIVSMRLIFPGGAREDQTDTLGLSSLFQRTWTSGTKSFSALQISHTLESLGASLYSFSGRNTSGLGVEFLSKQWNQVHPLLSEILLSPSFPEEEVAIEKNIQLRDIIAEKDSPGSLCHHNFMGLMYADHPSGRSSLGTQETVSKLGPQQLRQYYKDFIHQKSLVISTVGAIEPLGWVEELAGLCGSLPQSGRSATPQAKLQAPKKIQVACASRTPLFQSHLLIGFLGASLQEDQRFALKILSSCLAGQGGRLFLELRDRQSLAYSVSPINNDGPERGIFGFYIGCGPEKLQTAIVGIRKELDKILKIPMSARELSRAKEYWIGRFELEMQRYASQAMLFGLDEQYGLGHLHSFELAKKIKAVTAKEVQQAAIEYLNPEHASFSIVHTSELDPEAVKAAWEGSVSRTRQKTREPETSVVLP